MEKFKYNYDYTKTMMMKLDMAIPDRKGGTEVINTFADALEIIKKVDAVTCGMPKIIYLVGWQYNGHDDKYPDFFEVNKALKFPDKTPLESMHWLMEEAQKYHTTVSVHINFNDAYESAPSYERFLKANALIRNRKGNPDPIEKYNGLPCYKTSFKEYWESGLFKAMFDRLLEILPLENAKTVHVDNFQCYKNYHPYISMKEMQSYRRKMIEYAALRGVDITTEFTYREHSGMFNKMPFNMRGSVHSVKEPIDTLGLIPAVWWHSNITKRDLINITPQQFCGGLFHFRLKNYLYGNIHGEDIFPNYSAKNPDWEQKFAESFAVVQVPFQYLCNFKRLKFKGFGENERCIFGGGVVSYNKNRRITVNGETVKEKETLFLPLSHLENTYLAYSKKGDERAWRVPSGFKRAEISVLEKDGYVFKEEKAIENEKLTLKIQPTQSMFIKLY